jgi:hypothetical protein
MKKTIAGILSIDEARARYVLAYLLLQYGRTSHLSKGDIIREYNQGGICATIDEDLGGAERLALSFGL